MARTSTATRTSRTIRRPEPDRRPPLGPDLSQWTACNFLETASPRRSIGWTSRTQLLERRALIDLRVPGIVTLKLANRCQQTTAANTSWKGCPSRPGW
jgi:hypothetical protein